MYLSTFYKNEYLTSTCTWYIFRILDVLEYLTPTLIQSDLVTVDSGVPQGTVLGPILFLLHINDLPSVIYSKVRLFADDCLVCRKIKSRQDQNDLQKDLNLLENWESTWGMRFNAAKCNIMRVSRKQTPIPYQYELSGQVLTT